ncbi:MAG: sialidase family protein [Planctomycetota bacterium]|jgi:hypothetical protein
MNKSLRTLAALGVVFTACLVAAFSDAGEVPSSDKAADTINNRRQPKPIRRYEIRDLTTTVISAEPGAHVSRNAIKVLPDGTWALVYNRANNHCGTEWSCVNIRFSKNYGKTWSNKNTCLDGSPVKGLPCRNSDNLATSDPWLYVAPNGDLVIHFWRIDWRKKITKGTWAIASHDGGRTWSSSPQQVKFEGIADSNRVFCGEQDFCVDGRLYAGFREFSSDKFGHGRCFFAVSDDNGLSFKMQGHLQDPTKSTPWMTGEAGYEYLGSQDIVAVVFGYLREGGLGRQLTFVTYSHDMGKTWTPLHEVTAQTDSIHRPRVYTRKHLQQAPNWWDDDVLICTGTLDQSRSGNINRGRTNSVWISPDRGQTWTTFWGLDAKFYDGGYGDLAYDPDEGKFLVIMYTGDMEETVLKQYRFRIIQDGAPL